MHSDDQFAGLKEHSQTSPLSRRDFMRVLTAATSAGTGLMAAGLAGFSLTRSQRAEAAEAVIEGLGKLPKVQYGTKMGKIMVTPICMCQDWNSELWTPGIQAGINFIHKAGYWGPKGPVPDEIKKLDRESYYTDITVDNTSPRHDPDNYDEAYNQVVSSLEQNGLKYYDVFRAHWGWHSAASFNKGDNASYRAFTKLKKEGKVKYFGVSQHPYVPTEGLDKTVEPRTDAQHYADMLQLLIDSGLIDSMQVWFSYGYPKEAMDVFAKASKAGIAMTAMKVYAHGSRKMRDDTAKQEELKAKDMVGRACLRHVLAQTREDGKPIFHTCVTNLRSLQTFEENVGAASKSVTLRDGFSLPYA